MHCHSEVDGFFRVILQGLAARAVAIRPTDNTVQPRTTMCKSPPIVWSSQFVKGLDLII